MTLSKKSPVNDVQPAGLWIDGICSQGIGPLTLHASTGECAGICGPSGAGKTLFLRAVADMDPHQGRVFLNGAASTSMSGPEWRRRVGYLPSESAWWFETVNDHFQNVDPGWFRELGFDDDVLNWRISRLSSGERQRLALIRLLANHPQALLLDEPTANLDADNILKAEDFLTAFIQRHQPPVIWVSHDPAQLDRVAHHQFRLSSEGLLSLSGISDYNSWETRFSCRIRRKTMKNNK